MPRQHQGNITGMGSGINQDQIGIALTRRLQSCGKRVEGMGTTTGVLPSRLSSIRQSWPAGQGR